MAKKPSGTERGTGPDLGAHTRVALFTGKERFLQDVYTQTLREALERTHGEVTVVRFDGATAAPADVLDECRSYSLMGGFKLVVVDQADAFVKGGDDEPPRTGRAGPRQVLEAYAASPADSATLVLRAETWHPGNLDKAIAKVGCVIKCERPTDDEAAKWAYRRCKARHGAEIDPRAAMLLVEHLGADLGRIDSELAKLAVAVAGAGGGDGGTITVERVEAMVGVSREDEFWAIQAALLTGDAAAGLEKLRELVEVSRHDPVPITFSCIDLARKLHGAACMMERGVPEAGIAGRLKLWGSTRFTILEAARRMGRARAAKLLQHAVKTDVHLKSSMGEPVRNLELLTLRFAGVGE